VIVAHRAISFTLEDVHYGRIVEIMRPEVRTSEVRRLQQLDGITGAMCRSAVLLEDKCVTCYLFDAGIIC